MYVCITALGMSIQGEGFDGSFPFATYSVGFISIFILDLERTFS